MDSGDSSVVQLIPPSVGGVSDYACALQSGGLGGSIIKVTKSDRPSFRGGETVFLHYSGYGYARRGAPLWLLRWLREERPRIGRLGVFFHELYAMGPAWKSEFWLSPVQRHIARQLAELADFWLTNRQASAQWLESSGKNKLRSVLAIPSGVGEAEQYLSSCARSQKMIIFGGPGLRAETYRTNGPALVKWAGRLGIALHDVGPTISDPDIQAFLFNAGVVCHGRLEAAEVSDLLRQCRFGALTYSSAYAAKSSVLGAYCAHGVCPVIFPDLKHPGESLDGLKYGVNIYDGMLLRDLDVHVTAMVAEGAWDWYSTHRVERHVAAIKSLSRDKAPTS